jgi:signal transduction histidine kinase
MEGLLDPEGTGVLRVDFRTAQRPGRWLTATGRAFFDGLTPVKVVGTFRQPALLAEICAEVVDEAAREHPSHPIHFERWDDAPGEWDTYPLTEVARSLIGSAVMRSDPGAPIVVSVANCGEQALMIVADLGEPLPKEIREHLLDPEHHDEAPSTHPTLCSAVEIVQAHGGRLDLSSEHDSTVFHVWLPRVRRLALGARS